MFKNNETKFKTFEGDIDRKDFVELIFDTTSIMDLINTIIAKKDWQEKLDNDKISTKWFNEFIHQSANKKILTKVFQLLKKRIY